MSEILFDGLGFGPLKAGPTRLLLDPFTPNERWVLEDSDEAKAWRAAHPPSSQALIIERIDYEGRTVTFR